MVRRVCPGRHGTHRFMLPFRTLVLCSHGTNERDPCAWRFFVRAWSHSSECCDDWKPIPSDPARNHGPARKVRPFPAAPPTSYLGHVNTPSIDLSYLERLYKGDRARVHAWVNIYLEELPILLARMDTCIRQDDAAGLVQVLHDLRPQAHYLGAREMHDILERMGSEARSRGASACTSCALELRATCQAVERSLRTSFRSA